MTAAATPPTIKDRLHAIEGNLHDVRSLVAMVAAIFAICDDFDVLDRKHLKTMAPGLRFVVGQIDTDLSTAIDALDLTQVDITDGAR